MSTPTFYFYDLETSGFNPREQRIMQFAGQRTDMDLNPVGEPHNMLITLAEDALPDPDAVMITGITPQQTQSEGMTEVKFLKIFYEEVATPGTIFIGFNSIRFDDEFMRYLMYRNFYDAYEWQWKDDRSRWDLLDLVRMTRALRPEGINWPFDSEGKPANRLEFLTSVNKLDHQNAHDALSDVLATIAVAKLIQTKQPKLFSYLLGMRTKDKVAELVNAGQPFVYTSGKYATEHEKTTVAVKIGGVVDKQNAHVFDLRFDPLDYKDMTVAELAEAMKWKPKGSDEIRLPVKTMKFNRCPAVAPLSVLDEKSIERLHLDMDKISQNFKNLQAMPDFADKLSKAFELLDKARAGQLFVSEHEVDGQLYDGFIQDQDKVEMSRVRAASPDKIIESLEKFKDDRLRKLLPLYKARNFKNSLTPEEKQAWEKYWQAKLFAGEAKSRLHKYLARIAELKNDPKITTKQQHLLVDLELYAESIIPFE